MKVAVTEGARQRLLAVLERQTPRTSQSSDAVVAKVEVARLSRDELGSRLVPLAGAYTQASAQVRPACTPCTASWRLSTHVLTKQAASLYGIHLDRQCLNLSVCVGTAWSTCRTLQGCLSLVATASSMPLHSLQTAQKSSFCPDGTS